MTSVPMATRNFANMSLEERLIAIEFIYARRGITEAERHIIYNTMIQWFKVQLEQRQGPFHDVVEHLLKDVD